MTTATAPVTAVRTDGLCHVVLNRPHALNAWSLDFGRTLARVLREEATAPDIRAVLITGAGRGFSAGLDIREPLSTGPDGEPDLREELEAHHSAMLALHDVAVPVVAAVGGPAYGIGCSLAFACDVTIAGESAVFGPSWTRIGLVPDGGATLTLTEAVGRRRAFALAALSQELSGHEAAELGLVNAVVPDDALLEEATAIAQRLAAGPTRALVALKQALNAAAHDRFPEQLQLEERLQLELARTADFPEGLTALRERRPPRFAGC